MMLQTFAVMVVIFAAVSPAFAQHTTPLPDDPTAAFTSPEMPQRWRAPNPTEGAVTAQRCAVESGTLVCDCVHGDGWVAERIVGETSHGVRRLDDAVSVGTLQGGVATDVAFVLDDVVVQFGELRRDGDAVVATGVVWHLAEDALSLVCGAPLRLGAQIARADEARWHANAWRLVRLRVGPWPVPLAADSRRAAPGFLPPTVRAASPDLVEAEVTGHLGFNLLALAAAGVATSDAGMSWSAGLGYVSHDDGRTTPLRAVVNSEEGEFGAAAFGRLSLGERAHVRATVEHPMTPNTWALRRREAGGFFRDWRATRLGVSASGDAHALQLSGEVLTLPSLQEETWVGELRYGTAFITGPVDWSVDLEQLSDRIDSARHSILFGLGASTTLGRANAFWLRPSADLLANFAAVTVARGFDASTSLSALAQLEAGVAIEGRARGVRHRVAPVVRAGAEVYGVQQRQPREGAREYPYTAPTQWRYVGAFLQHALDVGPIAFETPVGVVVDTHDDSELRSFAFGRFEARIAAARVTAAVVCDVGCRDVAASIGGTVQLGRWFASYRVSDMDPTEVDRAYSDRSLVRGVTAVRLVQSAVRPGDPIGQALRVGFAGRQLRASVEGFVAQRDASGVQTDLAWMFPAAGWGVGVGAGWAPARDDWAANVGLVIQ